jgi:hypothetical protein
MSRSAKVTSVEALQAFRGSLQKYQADVRDALVQLTIEVRRGLDWIENDRLQYWRRQYRGPMRDDDGQRG